MATLKMCFETKLNCYLQMFINYELSMFVHLTKLFFRKVGELYLMSGNRNNLKDCELKNIEYNKKSLYLTEPRGTSCIVCKVKVTLKFFGI